MPDHLPGMADERIITDVKMDGIYPFLLLCKFDQIDGFLGGHGHRLLTHDMLTEFQGTFGHRIVQLIGRTNMHHVYFRIIQNRIKIRSVFRHIHLLRFFLQAFQRMSHNCFYFRQICAAYGFDMFRAYKSHTDNCNF